MPSKTLNMMIEDANMMMDAPNMMRMMIVE
jgi:hypothetical protein